MDMLNTKKEELIFKGEYLNGKIWGGKGYVVKAISYMS